MIRKQFRNFTAVLGTFAALGCASSDPTGSGGSGRVTVTTWGEEYIEDQIPAASEQEDGFVDGWSVQYEKFLVSFQKIQLADAKGGQAALMADSVLFDNHARGVKEIANFDDVAAQAWTEFSYEIAPVTKATQLSASATAEDKQLMLAGKYSLYVAGTAQKGDASKHFAWGFAIGTRYHGCHSEQDGRDEAGVVVTNNADLEVQLTTHGDHLFYDRLQASPDPAIQTALRFESLAAADQDEDGEVTLEELNSAPLNVRLYDPSGLRAATLGAFVTSLARTIGHFRGEGECTISAVD